MSETIGVLITYFNEKELLAHCLNSLIRQTNTPDEILIYDNASDVSAENFVPRDCPATVIRGNENRGPSYGRNVLLQASKSDYVHFHDADDSFHPNWCERVSEKIMDSEVDVVFTEASLDWGNKVTERIVGLCRLVEGKELMRFIIQDSMGIGVPIGTYRRSKVLAIGGYTERLWYGEDVDFHARLVHHGISYTAIDEPLIHLFYREPSHSHRDPRKCVMGKVEALLKMVGDLPIQYRRDLAEKLAAQAIVLFRMGAVSEARKTFLIAQEIGPATFNDQRKLYRLVARHLGAETAERLMTMYRAFVPKTLRSYIAQYR